MAIIEKKITIKLENPVNLDVKEIEERIKQAGVEPCRWAIVEMSSSDLTILANGTEISC